MVPSVRKGWVALNKKLQLRSSCFTCVTAEVFTYFGLVHIYMCTTGILWCQCLKKNFLRNVSTSHSNAKTGFKIYTKLRKLLRFSCNNKFYVAHVLDRGKFNKDWLSYYYCVGTCEEKEGGFPAGRIMWTLI